MLNTTPKTTSPIKSNISIYDTKRGGENKSSSKPSPLQDGYSKNKEFQMNATVDKEYTKVNEKVRRMLGTVKDLATARVQFKKICEEGKVDPKSDRHNVMHYIKDLSRKSNFDSGDPILETVHKLLKDEKGRGLDKNGGRHHVASRFDAGMKAYKKTVKKVSKPKKITVKDVPQAEASNE